MEYKLRKGEIMAIATKASGGTLSCSGGALWLTVEADPTDHELGPGARLTLPRRRKAVVQALEASTVTVNESQPPRRWPTRCATVATTS